MAGVSVATIPRLFLGDISDAKHPWGWKSNTSSISSSDDEATRSGPISPLASTSSLPSLSSNDDDDSDVSSISIGDSENDVASLCSSAVGSISSAESDHVRPVLHRLGAVNDGWSSVLAVPRVLYAHQIVEASQHAAHASPPKPARHIDTSDDDADGEELRPVLCLTHLHRFELPAAKSSRPTPDGMPYVAPHIAAAFPCKSHDEWYLSYADIQHLLDVYVRPSDAVVDLGAGRSQLARDMVLHGYHNVTAIDNDAKLLPCVEASLAPFLHVERMDAMQLQIAPASIDAVVAKAFFELLAVSTQCAVLTQVLACLRPGGTLFVVALNNGKAWWTQPDVARLLARTAVCIDDQPVGPIVGSHIDRSHACRARVWRTRASVIDANHRANCDAIRTLAARYEWRLRAFERQLQTEEAVHDDVLCLELPQMMNEDFRSLLLRQKARSRTNDKDIARAQVLKEPSMDEQAAPCANLASPATTTIISEPPISARTESRNESLQDSGSDLRAYPEVVVLPHVFSALGDEAFASEATDGDAACPPLESESYGASETRHGVAVALVTHVLADSTALASSPVKKRSRPGVAATETRLESHERPQPRGIDPVHGVAVALVNHDIADVAAHVPSPRKAVLLQSQRSTATDTVLEGQQNKVIASPGTNLSTAAIKHGVAVALVTQLITDATERASSPKKLAPEAMIESSLQEPGVAINNTSPDDDAEMSRVQAHATDAAVISETEHLSPVADENAPALGSMTQDTSKCMVESPKSSPHGAAIVDTTSTKEPERLPFQETDDNPDVADEVLEDATRAQYIEAPALAPEAAAVPQAFELEHALLPSSLLRANCEVDPAACANEDAPPSQRMRDAAPSVHPSSADGCALNEVGGILARLVDDVENACIKDDCRLALAALIDALLS